MRNLYGYRRRRKGPNAVQPRVTPRQVVVIAVDSHIQRIVLATEETTDTSQP